MKNEEPYVLEWVAFHRLIGFDRIVIYENDSTDGTAGLLEALSERGIIDEYIPWHSINASPQISAYQNAVVKCTTDWLMFLDADEFLNIRSRVSVTAFLECIAPETSCVGVNWRMFGSGGHKQYQEGLVLERFVRASAQSFSGNLHVKSFFRPSLMKSVHIHAPEMAEGAALLASGAPLEMPRRGIATVSDFSIAQVNHYFTKSYEEYLIKRKRGNANRRNEDPTKFKGYTDDMFHATDLNDEFDNSITWAAPEVKKQCDAFADIIAGKRTK
jgi:glycosyltransferase involved in cell wall biosynthesis